MTRFATTLAPLGVAALLAFTAAPASAQITTAVLEGDNVAGVGNVTLINNLDINSNGEWIVEVDTDNANTDIDAALIKNGALYLQEGQALAEPVGASINTFDSVNLNNNGDSGWNFFLSGTSGTGDDSGIYFNDGLVLQEGTISGSPDFSPGTPYIGFFDAKIDNNNSNQIFVVASVDDPNIATTVDRALVIMTLDGSGNLVSEAAPYKEGDTLPGQIETVADFGTGPHLTAFNDGGDILFFADLNGATATDGVIYLNDTLLAQEGSPSPVGGRNYEFLSSRGLDLSNSGHWVHKANLDGATTDDELIVLDGAVFRREGDTLPAISPFLFTAFGTGSGPVAVDDAGNVLWFGDWDDPNTDIDTGLFLNDQLLVQEGVTMIDGMIVDTIQSGEDAFRMSDSGQYVIFEAQLVGGIDGAFIIDLGPPVSVELSQLEASVVNRTVEVTWVTSAQVDHDGFHVYRSSAGSFERVRLTDELVRGQSWHRFVDDSVQGDRTYLYYVGAVDIFGDEVVYGPARVTTPNWTIRVTGLLPAAPNPFVRKTDLRFSLDRTGEMELAVVDVAGRVVRRLDRGSREAGDHRVTWDGRDDAGRPLPAGVYFARLEANGVTQARKVVLLGK